MSRPNRSEPYPRPYRPLDGRPPWSNEWSSDVPPPPPQRPSVPQYQHSRPQPRTYAREPVEPRRQLAERRFVPSLYTVPTSQTYSTEQACVPTILGPAVLASPDPRQIYPPAACAPTILGPAVLASPDPRQIYPPAASRRMPVVTSRDPTNIRDASSGSHPPMTPPTFGSRSHNPFLNRATAAQPPNVDEEHHCNVCSRSFHSERGLEAHIEAEHVPCDEEGCSFTAPARYMIFHAMKHVRDRQGRLPDDPEVVNEWIARRRARFPGSKKKEKGAGPLPMFESMLKKGAGTAHGLNIRGSSAFIPSMSGVLRREREIHDNVFETVPNNNMPVPARRQRMQGLLESYLNKAAVMQGKRSIPHYLLREPFKICERVLSKKDCKFGADCKQSHDLAAYYRYLDLRHQANLDIHMRPPLIYRLVKDDVCEYETKLLMAIRFLVKSGFLKV